MVAVTARSHSRARRAAAIGLLAVLTAAAPAYAAPEDSSSAASESGSSESGSADPSASSSSEPTTSAAPAVACETPPQPSPIYEKVPWTVSTVDPPERLWPYSTGKGVTVAVVSTGVSTTHPQLADRLSAGYDFVRNLATGMDDCVGQGTSIASVIAAQPSPSSGFVGLAPDATILPVRIAEQDQVVRPTDKVVAPSTVASGIAWATQQGADVIVVGTVIFYDDPALKAAVEQAQASGAVIVAPVGDDHPKDAPYSEQPTPPDRTPYPAAYDAVIGVGAVGPNGVRLPASEVGEYVDVVAPGEDVIAAATAGGHSNYTGTAIASAFAGAAVALLMGQPGKPWANESGAARSAQVQQRLRSTASPVSGHFAELGYGGGLVDPSRAMTDLTNQEAAASAAPYTPPARSEDERKHAQFEKTNRSRAVGWTWGVLAGLVAACIGYFMLRRVRQNGARALETPMVSDAERDQELKYVPGEQLFAPPPEPK